MYDTLLFDLDGTLTDSKPGIINCVKYALNAFGITQYSEEWLNQFVGPPLMTSFQEFLGFDEEKAARATEKYRERFSTIGIFENAAFDGAVTMLKQLKQAGKQIGLSTSKPEEFTLRIIEKYGLAPYIDEPVGASMDGSREKKSDVINEALKRFHIDTPEKRNRTIMIGDRKYDILGAKECGLKSIGCMWGYAQAGELEEAGADHLISSIPELTDFLLKK